ncbi:hypothetical protein NE865_16495 [Phthorimaea operculella]|nr:hypothetical protein NE865_16495 [Phthorimaea operculella]
MRRHGGRGCGHARGLRVYKIVVLGDGGKCVGRHAAVEFTAMREQHALRRGLRPVLPVTDRRSFRAAAEYRRLLARETCRGCHLCWWGISWTSRLSLDKHSMKRNFKLSIIFQVSIEEGKALATQLGCPFFETSAALRHFVDDAFHALIRRYAAWRDKDRRVHTKRVASLPLCLTRGNAKSCWRPRGRAKINAPQKVLIYLGVHIGLNLARLGTSVHASSLGGRT